MPNPLVGGLKKLKLIFFFVKTLQDIIHICLVILGITFFQSHCPAIKNTTVENGEQSEKVRKWQCHARQNISKEWGKVWHKQKAWFKSFNIAISFLFTKPVFYRIPLPVQNIFSSWRKYLKFVCQIPQPVTQSVFIEVINIFRMKEAGKRK